MCDRYCFAFLETIACFLASHSFVSSLFSFQGTPGGGRFAYSVPRGSFLRIFHRCSFLAACGGVSSSCSRFCIAGYKDGEMPPVQPVVGSSGLEPPTSRLSGVRSNHLSYEPIFGGDKRDRTADPLLARQVLSQLSYTPKKIRPCLT